MSCFIVSNENLSILADFIYKQNNFGFNFTGLDIPDELSRIFRNMEEKEIFATLYKENLLAYDSRYTHEPTQDILPDGYKDSGVIVSRYCSKEWYMIVYKKLQCYLYQLCEDGTINGDIYKFLTECKNRIASAIIGNMEEYKNISWS